MAARRSDAPLAGWFGAEVRFEAGRLEFSGSLRIDGEVVDAALTGPSLTIGPDARVSGRVEVERLEVAGRFEGRASVSDRALVQAGGELRGELLLDGPGLEVEDGGRLHARVRSAEPGASAPPR